MGPYRPAGEAPLYLKGCVYLQCWSIVGGGGGGVVVWGLLPCLTWLLPQLCVSFSSEVYGVLVLKCHQVLNHMPVLLEGTYIRATLQMKNPNLRKIIWRISHEPRRNPSVLTTSPLLFYLPNHCSLPYSGVGTISNGAGNTHSLAALGKLLYRAGQK